MRRVGSTPPFPISLVSPQGPVGHLEAERGALGLGNRRAPLLSPISILESFIISCAAQGMPPAWACHSLGSAIAIHLHLPVSFAAPHGT